MGKKERSPVGAVSVRTNAKIAPEFGLHLGGSHFLMRLEREELPSEDQGCTVPLRYVEFRKIFGVCCLYVSVLGDLLNGDENRK